MGLSPFKNCSTYQETSPVVAPNPNPVNFKIMDLTQIGSSVVAKIKYPDCTNFEGVKICVFENTTALRLSARAEIDPHFSSGDDSPIARFKPTGRGVALACQLAESLGG